MQFWYPMGPTCDPWGAIFGHRAPKGEVLRTIFCVLGPTWARPVTQNHPRTHLQRFDVDFGLIWDRNLSDFEYMWVAKGIFVMVFSWIFM